MYLVAGDKIDLSTSLKLPMLLPSSQTQVSFSAAQMGLIMTNNGPAGSTILVSNKQGLSDNLHSILNRQVNNNDFQPILPRHVIKSVIPTKNTDQQEPNKEEFDHCDDHTSSDSSNNSKSALEKTYLMNAETTTHLKKSPIEVSTPHTEKTSYKSNTLTYFNPPDLIWWQKLNY